MASRKSGQSCTAMEEQRKTVILWIHSYRAPRLYREHPRPKFEKTISDLFSAFFSQGPPPKAQP